MGEKIQTWWTLNNEVESFDNLEFALAGPTGVSGGTAAFAPRLLMPHRSRSVLDQNFGTTKYAGVEIQDGVECHKLEATEPSRMADSQTVWIEKERLLVLRIEYQRNFDAEEQRAIHEERMAVLRERAANDPAAKRILDMLESEPRSFESFTTEQTVLYRPELNCEIEREVFEFEPPNSGD